MLLDEFHKFLRSKPDALFASGRVAFRSALCACHPGQTISLHECHAVIDGRPVQLERWSRRFLELVDAKRYRDRDTVGSEVLEEALSQIDE